MKSAVKAPLFLLGLSVGLALLIAITNVGHQPVFDPAAAAASQPVPAEADAAVGQYVLSHCGTCHGLNELTSHPQDASGWSQTVDQMIQMGAQVAPQEKPALVDYLTKHFGPTN